MSKTCIPFILGEDIPPRTLPQSALLQPGPLQKKPAHLPADLQTPDRNGPLCPIHIIAQRNPAPSGPS